MRDSHTSRRYCVKIQKDTQLDYWGLYLKQNKSTKGKTSFDFIQLFNPTHKVI